MRLPLYQIDAFTERLFRGNPAAVCPLDQWLPAATMQAIAAENNLAETAFFVPEGEGYGLRWFTPEVEVDLCGHATLASAHVIFEYLQPERTSVTFSSRSGPLTVTRCGRLLSMDLPAWPPEACDPPETLLRALGAAPEAVLSTRDWLCVYASEAEVRSLKPDFRLLANVPGDRLGVIVTAPGEEGDFVSRFFAPGAGIPEDPVTGSAHCTLTPYWAHRLRKDRLEARQISVRGGQLLCEMRGDRVFITGACVRYLEGWIEVEG